MFYIRTDCLTWCYVRVSCPSLHHEINASISYTDFTSNVRHVALNIRKYRSVDAQKTALTL